jgi:hypothetical protein
MHNDEIFFDTSPEEHYPNSVTKNIFENIKVIVIDPTHIVEDVCIDPTHIVEYIYIDPKHIEENTATDPTCIEMNIATDPIKNVEENVLIVDPIIYDPTKDLVDKISTELVFKNHMEIPTNFFNEIMEIIINLEDKTITQICTKILDEIIYYDFDLIDHMEIDLVMIVEESLISQLTNKATSTQ